MTTGKEMLFVAKCLAWRMEKPEERTVQISFASYGLGAYLHGKNNSCASCWSDQETGEYSLEEAIKKINELESVLRCQSEVSEEQKLATFCDAEPNGTTVGMSN